MEMCTINEHFNYQLDYKQIRRRLISYKPTLNPETSDDSNSAIHDQECFLIGLSAGEYFLFNKSVNLKVICGCAEISGHLYSVMDSYRKFNITPWSPSERLLSLCYKLKPKRNKSVNHIDVNGVTCVECNNMLNELYGGTCCQFVSSYKAHRKLVMKHFGVKETELPLESNKYSEHVKYYESQMNQEFDTIVMMSDYTSCFGTIGVYDSLNAHNSPKLLYHDILTHCEKILRLFVSGSNPTLMLHGDKGSGKSTIVKYVINYLLNFVSSVCLMDVDIGQPIVSAPGLITLTFMSESITSSNHTMVRDVKSKLTLLLGDIRVSNSLVVLRHVKKCLDMYDKHQKSFKSPLIINTFGWTLGLGGRLIDAIGSMCKVEVVLKLVMLPKLNQTISIYDHEDLKDRISQLSVKSVAPKRQFEEYDIDTFPLFGRVVEELGGKLPWDKSNKEYYISSFQNYINLFRNCNFDNMCNSNQFYRLIFKREREFVSGNDMRWLRFCSYFNGAFADALHFPQLRHEEFFGGVDTHNFTHNIKHVDKFKPPKQTELNAASYTFVTQSDILPKEHSELVPMISGSIIALCKGKVNGPFRSRVSDQFHFVSYAYVHYMNPEDLTLMISYPKNKSPQEIANTNVIVLCIKYGFDTCPGKLCSLNSYPSNNTQKLDHITTQMYPFRRNDLLHMVGAYGAGTSAPTQRSNLKRFKNENVV